MIELFKRIAADARFYYQLAHPHRNGGTLAALALALRSRGWWLLVMQRLSYYNSTQRNLRNPFWWMTRLAETGSGYLAAVLAKSELQGDCRFEGNVYLSDKGYLVFGALSVGDGTIIHDHVTSGYGVADRNQGRPAIGRNVWIGPGCIVVGELTVGDGATLLPGTFLTTSVPPNCVMYGNPARVKRLNFDNAPLRSSLAVVHDLPSGDA